MNFDTEKTIKYWIEGDDYDFSVAQSLYEKEKYPYALFFGHLALEKALKAIYVKNKQEHAPFTHSLPQIADNTGLKFPKNILTKLSEFMEFYFQSRYPDEQKLFHKKCTKKYT